MSQETLFVALLLPPEIEQVVTELKHYCAKNFESEKALNSPPHITLQPPFKFPTEDKTKLLTYLQDFAQKNISIPITLDGFSCFEPRVIYIDVEQTPELFEIQAHLKLGFAEQFKIKDERYGDRPFHPHVTIAFKDLTKANFYHAWEEFKTRSIHYQFTVNKLTLLKHDGRVWRTDQDFLFNYSNPK